MNHFNAQRWSLWSMAAFGLGDSRSGTGGSRSDSKTNSGGRSSSPGESRSGGTSSKGSTSKGSTGTSSGTGSNSRSGSVGFSGGGGEGGAGRSSGSSVGSRSSSSPGASRGGTSRGASVGSTASAGSTTSTASRGTTSTSTSTGRQSSKTGTGGTIGGGLVGAVGLTGSGLADKGGRVTGGFDSGRFGDAPAAATGGRVTSTPAGFDSGRLGPSITAEKGGRVSAAATPSRQPAASVGRQSSRNGQYDNGGINAAQIGPSVAVGKESRVTNIADKGARVTSAVGSKIGNGLAGGYAPPTRSARDVEAKSMDALAASRTPVGSLNYGAAFAQQARVAEDASIAKHGAWQDALGTIRSVEAQRAKNPVTGATDPYNGLVYGRDGKRVATHANLTDMTISEVQDYQRGMIARGHASTAVGAYQTIQGTLGEAVRRTGIDPDTKFTKATQDYLGQDLISNRVQQATRNGKVDPERLADRLSKEWAGLANRSGRSSHHGVAGNKSGNSYAGTLAAATGLVDTGAVGAGPAKGGRVTSPARTASEAIKTISPTERASPRSRTANASTARDPAAERFETKYLGKSTVPTPTARPDQKLARSPVDKVLAGAIDVGVGLLPGVGTVAAVYGAAAPLLGLPSVGDLALSLRDKNQFDLKTQLRGQDGDTGTRTEERLQGAAPVATREAPTEPATSASAASTAPATFEEKYLSFSDPTARLTPAQKWGGSGANDVAYSL